MKKIFLGFILFNICLLFFLTSCGKLQNGVDIPQKGTAQFSLQLTSSQTKTFSIASTTNTAILSYIQITVVNSLGEKVMDKREIPITKFNNTYISSEITLDEGTYSITEFIVLNDQKEVVYITPIQNSDRASSVTQSLPIELVIQKNKVVSKELEVVKITSSDTPANFGYAQFHFKIVDDLYNLSYETIYKGDIGFIEPQKFNYVIKTNQEWQDFIQTNSLVIPSTNIDFDKFTILVVSQYVTYGDSVSITMCYDVPCGLFIYHTIDYPTSNSLIFPAVMVLSAHIIKIPKTDKEIIFMSKDSDLMPTISQDNTNTIEAKINVGSTYSITLNENATTGYQWFYTLSNSDVIQYDYYSDNSSSLDLSNKTGEGCQITYTFKALKTGSCDIVFKYYRSWEGEASAIKTCTYKLKVI